MGLILDRINDYQLKNPSRKLALCNNAGRLTGLVRIPIYDSDLEINGFYSVLTAIMKRSLFIIRCVEEKLLNPEADLEVQERSELKSEKQIELDVLRQVLFLAGKIIRIHPSLSIAFCEDLYHNIFQKVLAEPELIVGY